MYPSEEFFVNISEIKNKITSGELDASFIRLYGNKEAVVASHKERYLDAINEFEAIYGDKDLSVFSVGGRSEISGNHTDHNLGRVIAAAVDLDIIAVASKREDSVVNVKSKGFDPDKVDLCEYTEPIENKFFTSESIIAGVSKGFKNAGYSVGGFDAYTTSNVLGGSGLSSSASFEDMIGNIFNHFYNDGKVENAEIAKIAQFAENKFFGKPCGLMDQTACAVGGFVAIDFADPTAPVINPLNFDLSGAGYSLCIVSTGGSHADLNEDYASIPAEMKAVAAHFGHPVLRGLSDSEVISEIPALREKVGDRAILRALHFIAEDARVPKQAKALSDGDLDTFFALVRESGNSSYKYLQNVYTTKKVDEQGLSLALCLTENYLSGKRAAWRVHGGGFAGTIQAFVPNDEVEGYRKFIDSAFGDGSCHVLNVRPDGAIKVI